MAGNPKRSPHCLIVDDHPVVRAGVRAVLEQGFWPDSHLAAPSAEAIEAEGLPYRSVLGLADLGLS